MDNEERYDLSELTRDSETELRNYEDSYPKDDLITAVYDIADSNTPSCNHDILMYAVNNLVSVGLRSVDVGTVQNEHRDVDVVGVARAAIYDAIKDHLLGVVKEMESDNEG